MNKNSNTYIIAYSTIMVVVVAAVLSFAAISLKPAQEANVRVEKMGAILLTIGQGKEAAQAANKAQYIEQEYNKYITASFCVNAAGDKVEGGDAFAALGNLKEVFAEKEAMPVFEAKLDNGMHLYIVPMTGAGLWGPVWGYMALNDDCNTVYGAVFDHKSETPGLGAEISLPNFSNQFVGKKLFENGTFESIALTKGVGSSLENPYAVDAISGGTLTSNGVSAMLKNCLGDYVPFFEKVQAAASIPATLPDSMLVAPLDSLVVVQ